MRKFTPSRVALIFLALAAFYGCNGPLHERADAAIAVTDAAVDTHDAADAIADAPVDAVDAPDGTVDAPADAPDDAPDVTVEAPDVTVEAPDVTVEAPDVTVEAPDVTVDAPDVTVDAPDAGPALWETPLSASSLPAVQVNVSGDASRQWIFANMLRGSEAWLYVPGATAAASRAMADAVSLDANGWPTSFPPGAQMRIGAGYQTGPSTYLHGVYVLTWEGSGRVVLESTRNDGMDEETLLDDQARGRLVRVIRTPSKAVIVYVRSSDATNPVRNMRLWAPATDGAGLSLTRTSDLSPGRVTGSLEPAPGAPEPMWHPRFLQHLTEGPPHGVLRFMDWLRINESTWDRDPLTWSDRADESAPFGSFSTIDGAYTRYRIGAYRQRLGRPYEWMIDLCNRTGRDLWIQVPHVASDDLIRELANLVATRLNPELRVWFEYSNEIWNSIEPYLAQQNKARAVAAEHFGVAPAAVTYAQIAWGSGHLQGLALRTFEDAWRARGGTDARLINVLSGFVAVSSFSQQALDAAREIDPRLPEVLAVTDYFGYGTHGDIFALHPFGATPGVWPANLYDRTRAVVRRNLYETTASWRASSAVARAAGVPLVAYEGGQHMLPVGLGDWSNPAHADFMNFMYAFQRSPQINALYQEHFALWSAMGGRTASLFVDTGTWSFFGYWGAKEFVTQTRAESPKWDAFLTWQELHAGVRAPSEPVGTRPVLPALNTTAEAGLAYRQDITVEGGDGPVEVSIVGGELPPGHTYRQTGARAATIAGVPTAGGLYRFVLRALDGDRDPDFRAGSIVVDPRGVSTSALVVFRGQDIPATLPNNGWIARYNPVRPTTTVLDAAGRAVRRYIPFSVADGQALFDREGLEVPGTPHTLAPTSPLNMYGGWSLTAATPPMPSSLSTFTGLRDHQWSSWSGDSSGGASSFDALLVWRADQFGATSGAGAYSFGADATTALLRVDITALIADGDNELRFVVLDGDTWYLSEAAYTSPHLGDGYFEVANFTGSNTPGHRWAVFRPTADAYAIPSVASLTFNATTFSDVRAVGIAYRGRRWGYNYSFNFSRFLALGRRR